MLTFPVQTSGYDIVKVARPDGTTECSLCGMVKEVNVMPGTEIIVSYWIDDVEMSSETRSCPPDVVPIVSDSSGTEPQSSVEPVVDLDNVVAPTPELASVPVDLLVNPPKTKK